jgi:hypothetical protein
MNDTPASVINNRVGREFWSFFWRCIIWDGINLSLKLEIVLCYSACSQTYHRTPHLPHITGCRLQLSRLPEPGGKRIPHAFAEQPGRTSDDASDNSLS